MAHPGGPAPVSGRIEREVRRLTRRKLTTRQIAGRLPISQSTVVRLQHRLGVSTGPQPALPADGIIPAVRSSRSRAAAVIVLAAALLLLAAAVTAILWTRIASPVPDPVLCVHYGPAGTVTRIAASGPGGSCPAGWSALPLSG